MATTLDLERLSQAWEPKLRNAFLKAIRDAVGRINISDLAKLLEKGDIMNALRMVNLNPADFSQFALTHTEIFNSGGMATAASIPAIPQAAGFSAVVLYNVRNPVAEAWIRDRSSTLITQITEDQRVAIRGWLEQGLQQGLNPREVAIGLAGKLNPITRTRVGGIIGLHSNQEKWLANYSRFLSSGDPADLRAALSYGLRDRRFDRSVLKAINDGTKIAADIQEKMRLSYAARALKWRADSIARNETIRALGAAQTQAYQQAIDGGTLDQGLITRYWVTAGDERVRPTHRLIPGMNSDGRKWNEPFQTPDGPSMHAPHDFDIGCRCHERVNIDFLAQAVRANQNGY